MTLTPAGQRLLAHGRGILNQIERAKQDLEEQRGGHRAALAGPAAERGPHAHAPLVELFRERFPRATLTMVEGLSTYTLEWLAQGRIDCAVVYNAAPAPAFELLPVLQEELYLVSARSGSPNGLVGRPVAPADVARHELVIPSRPHASPHAVETALAEAGLKPRVGLEIESVPAILDLVQRHPLHAVLSLNAIAGSGQAERFRVRPIVAGRLPLAATLWIATSAQRPRGPLLEQALPLLSRIAEGPVGRGTLDRGSRRPGLRTLGDCMTVRPPRCAPWPPLPCWHWSHPLPGPRTTR